MDADTRRAAFTSGAALAVVLATALPSLGTAQVAPSAPDGSAAEAVPDAQENAEASVAEDVPEIVVTGSRIARQSEFTVSNPVVSIDAEAIKSSGTTNLGQFLQDLPALTGSLSSNSVGGSNAEIGLTGLELLNLRNLGIDRTLVLVNGRRHVAALPGSVAVDIDTIPIDLIERVDIQTGGSAAVYGADSVSGVVNFILKRDYEGFSARAQYGQSEEGEPDAWIGSLLAGRNFDDDRGNITGSFEYATESRIKGSDRDYAAAGRGRIGLVNNPADRDDDPNVPDRIPLRDIRFYDSSPDGLVYVLDPDFNIRSLFNGTGLPFDRGTIPAPPPDGSFDPPPIDPFFQVGGDGTRQRDYIGDLQPKQERYTANALLTYALKPSLRAFADLKYTRTESFSVSQPTFDFFNFIEADNFFLPSNIADAAGDDGFVFVSRDHFDLGVRADRIERQTSRAVLGLDGDAWQDAKFEFSLVYGVTDVDNLAINNRFDDRFLAALDSVAGPDGNPVCRSDLDPTLIEPGASFRPGPGSGCAPLNLFGNGSPSQAAIDFVMVNTLATSRVSQRVATAAVTGKFFNVFAPSVSPLSYVFGVERRIEKSEGHPALEDQAGFTFGNDLQPERGLYSVSEAFMELDVPLVEDRLLAHYFGMDAALRLSDYNTIGNTRTWKVGSTWSPIRDITFRGTRAKAVRAPNISELFDPGGQTFELILDPCDANNLDEGSSFRAANCAAILSAAGVEDPSTFIDTNSSSVAGTLRGNRDLEEEDADTTTIGIVLQPQFLPGFALALDWYDIEIDNAINTPFGEEAAELCVDAPTIDNNFCRLITREAGSGLIIDFLQQPQNVANFTTKGYDLNLSYLLVPSRMGLDANIGEFKFVVIGNKLQELTFINIPGAPADQDEQEGPREDGGQAPEWQVNFDLTWTYGPLTMNYGLNYFDKTKRFTDVERAGNPDIADRQFLDYEARLVQDIFVSYQVLSQWQVYGGVNNLEGREPDELEVAYPVSPIGRFFFAGVRFEAF